MTGFGACPLRARRLAILAFLSAAQAVPTASARDSDCVFRTPGPLHLAFGVLDPGRGGAVRQQATGLRSEDAQVGDCVRGTALSVRIEGGQHDTAPGRLRMRHALRADAYLRYTVEVSPIQQHGPGNGSYLTFQLMGHLDAADLVDAPAGPYQDTLRLSVIP